MMGRRYKAVAGSEAADLEAALAAVDADQLRGLIRDLLPQLDGRIRGLLVNNLVERAARAGSGWAPAGPGAAEVAAVAAFAAAAERRGYADPEEVDFHLRQGGAAFLNRRYGDARTIFQALLPPLNEGEIDLGQHELIGEVLSTDETDCTVQYLVAVYMTTEPEERARALMEAYSEVSGIGFVGEPLREMERVAVEPLPGLAEFLPRWRDVLEQYTAIGGLDWSPDLARWLREAVQRLEGVDGLARIARATGKADDLRAWCRSLLEAREWRAALRAFEEAASLVREEHRRGEFLDGAALAAQELGLDDQSARLEDGWRKAPSLIRLCRWLGSLPGPAEVRAAAAQALKACPRADARQASFLRVLAGDIRGAARLLAQAPGLGWSYPEHPGHLLFWAFERILAGDAAKDMRGWEGFHGDPGWWPGDAGEPQLATPSALEVLRLAGVAETADAETRALVLGAMRQAAEQRVAGVTGAKRRRTYGHAAELTAACAALDRSPAGARWLADLRARFSRYPALQSELAERLQ
ncbi:MAG: hypothetical protein AB1634_13105 [Thermodesulfobacteriota bacterium]